MNTNILAKEPALSAALLNAAVGALAYFGLHVSPDQLVIIFGVVSALFGIIVRANVSPLAKVEDSANLLMKTEVGRKLLEKGEAELIEHIEKR